MNTNEENKELPWIAAADSPWGIELLDLRPIAQAMLSTSKDKRMAENAVSYGGEDGSSFWGQMPQDTRKVEMSLSYPIQNKLYPGILFTPHTMEHKWAIYFDGQFIYFVRSWLREVYAVAETRQSNNQLILENIQGHFFDVEEDAKSTEAIAHFLLLTHALDELAPVPLMNDMKDTTYVAGLWSFSLCGNMGLVGVFDNELRIAPRKEMCTHSLLHLAVADNNIDAVKKYLAEGYDMHTPAGDGLTPLHWTLNAETLSELLKLGANPNVRSREGATPIMNAVQSENIEQLKILLEAGADINAQDNRGFTSLHRAAEMGKSEIVKYLLQHGADRNIVAQGYTALALAEVVKNEEIINILK